MTSALNRLLALRAARADQPPSPKPVVVTPEALTASVEALLSKHPTASGFSDKPSVSEPTKLTELHPDTGRDPQRVGSVGSVSCQLGCVSENQVSDEAMKWRDAYEEKAAIREHDGGLSRDEAEAAALLDMATRWRCENPLPASDRAACYHCGRPAPCTPVLAANGHAWLHQQCWAPMNERRQREALDAVTQMLNASKKDA